MLFDILIQDSALADLIQDAIDTSVINCQESQSAQNWKSTKAVGVKTQEFRVSALGIK